MSMEEGNYWGKWLSQTARDYSLTRNLPAYLDSIAKEVVGTRYGPKKTERDDDMLGSFVRNGLDQRQAEAEILNTV